LSGDDDPAVGALVHLRATTRSAASAPPAAAPGAEIVATERSRSFASTTTAAGIRGGAPPRDPSCSDGSVGGEDKDERFGALSQIGHDNGRVAFGAASPRLQGRRGPRRHGGQSPVLIVTRTVSTEAGQQQDEHQHPGCGDARP